MEADDNALRAQLHELHEAGPQKFPPDSWGIPLAHDGEMVVSAQTLSDEPRESIARVSRKHGHRILQVPEDQHDTIAAVLAEVERQDVYGVGGKRPGESVEAMHTRAAAAHIVVLLRLRTEGA
jgi:hypothetical protein